jgi:F-type H+-transporting ATPase subunit epsilon
MSMELEILAPDGPVVQTRVVGVRAADASGQFGILPGYERFLTLLAPCVIIFREEGKGERYAAADGGVLLVEGNRVSVATREAAVADRLEEVAAAAAAMLEARRRQEEAARTEFAELQAMLLRELRKAERGA